MMAREAVNLSDRVILTSDNPRFENPNDILNDMLEGLDAEQRRKTLAIVDRREAIRAATQFAQPGDVVLIAGKGHEDYQEIEGVKHHFDDKEEVEKLFAENRMKIQGIETNNTAYSFYFTVIIKFSLPRTILQIGELVRDLGLEGQMSKKGTPTMGGIIIIIAILIPCLLVGRLGNIYMILMLITTVWLGAIGFLDDYIKVFKKDKEGLHGRFKIVGQVGLGLIVGLTLFLSPDVVIRENVAVQTPGADTEVVKYESENIKSTQTTIPFFKNNNLDYADLVPFLGEHAQCQTHDGRSSRR